MEKIDEAAALQQDAIKFMDSYLGPVLDDASNSGENPAVVIYALLECAMRVSQAHFPDHAGQLYASATQLVFESHNNSPPN